MTYKVSVIVEKDEGGYFAYVPELDGCHTQGDSLDEVMGNIKEAAEVYLDNLDADDRRDLLSTQVLLTAVEVEMRDIR